MAIFLALLIVLLSGCRVGPNYRRPPAPAPPVYKEPPPSNFKEAGYWAQADPQDSLIRGNWWELFCDPSLNALEEQVNISNQNIAAAEAQYRVARAAVRATRAGLFPTIGISAIATAFKSTTSRSSSGVNVGGTGTFYSLPIDFSYEVDAWGQVRRAVEANVATAQASAADLETLRLSTHAELATDYYLLRGLDEQQRILDASISAFERTLQLTKNRFEGGVASGLDVAQAETQLQTTRAQAIDLQVQRDQLEHAIASLIGKPPADLTIAPTDVTTTPPVIPVGLPSQLLERRPDIAGGERRVAAANAQIGVAKAAYFPTIAFNADAGVQGSRLSSLVTAPARFWSLGPTIAQTIFDGGRRGALVTEAEAQYDMTVAQYRESVLTAFVDVEDNLAALRVLEDEAKQQEIAIQSAQRALEISLNRYRGGVASFLDVLTAQNALLTNQLAATQVHSRRMTASVLLIKALGGGWQSLDLPSRKEVIAK
jgi:NodT family efflux transporter outer membrane factor (OMF) lipoprotein